MITIDTLQEIFFEVQNDMQLMIAQSKEEFFRPELDRETVKMWLELPLVLKQEIQARNPKLAKNLDNKAEQLRKGQVRYER